MQLLSNEVTMHAVAILKELRRTYKHLSSLERDVNGCPKVCNCCQKFLLDRYRRKHFKKFLALILVPNPW